MEWSSRKPPDERWRPPRSAREYAPEVNRVQAERRGPIPVNPGLQRAPGMGHGQRNVPILALGQIGDVQITGTVDLLRPVGGDIHRGKSSSASPRTLETE